MLFLYNNFYILMRYFSKLIKSLNMKHIVLTLSMFLMLVSFTSCRETTNNVKEVQVEKESSDGGALERAAKKVDSEVNKEIDKAIDKIGND